MKRLQFPLPYNHTGIAEIEGDEVILYIEKPGTILWGLIDWPTPCTRAEIFQLRAEDDYQPSSLEYERVINGRVGRYSYNYRNINTFSPIAELERMFTTYQTEQQRRDAWEKRVEQFTNKF